MLKATALIGVYLMVDFIVGTVAHGATIQEKNPPAKAESIVEFESLIKETLPEEYKTFLKTMNGGSPDVPEHQGVYACFNIEWDKGQEYYKEDDASMIAYLYSVKKEDLPENYRSSGSSDLFDVYETFRAEEEDRIPLDTIAIGEDPGANQILLGITGENRGKVFYWFRDGEKDPDNLDPPDYSNVGLVASSFNEFLEKIYECRP